MFEDFGLEKRAIKYYKLANSPAPKYSFENYDKEIANLYMKCGKYKQAILHLEKAIKMYEGCEQGKIQYCGPENPEEELIALRKKLSTCQQFISKKDGPRETQP